MKTVAVQLTGAGVGAIAVVLLAGENAARIVESVTRGRAKDVAIGRILRVNLHDAGDLPIDDALIVRVAEDRFELHLHGGVAVVRAVLGVLAHAGARVVTAEEAGELRLLGDGLRGRVALAMPRARTITAARLLAAQVDGGIGAWSKRWRAWLGETGRDGAGLWPLQAAAQWLLMRSRVLGRLLEPARIALIGPPNAGKSTLANALLGRPVSITSDIPGTTRDWVDGQAVFVHEDVQVAVTLVDTAGVRETEDVLEKMSIERTHEQAAAADLVVLVLDATRPGDMPMDRSGALVVWNKSDLVAGDVGIGAVAISAKTGAGLEDLMAAVLRRLELDEVGEGEAFAFLEGQRAGLERLARCGEVRECGEILAGMV